MKKAFAKSGFVLLISAVSLLAADATGIWTGTFAPEGQEAGSAHMVLKQEGTVLTGTAGPSAEEQHEIRNGKAENGTLTFDLERENGVTMKFVLKQDGNAITGDATRMRDGEAQKAHLVVRKQN